MKLYKSSLTTADSLINSVLDNEDANIESLIKTINEFISAKGTFTGDAWDLHRNIFTKYIDILSTKAKMAHELASAMRSANQIMSDFLGGLDSFEDTYYDDVISARYRISSNNDNLSSNNNSNDGMSELINLGYSTVAEADAYIAKCDRFRAADTSAYAKLSATESLFTAASQESYDI